MDNADPRIRAIRTMFDTSGRGLEVGASHNPIVPKSAGFDVDVLDHATRDELRAKYAGLSPAAIERIEDVDFLWDGRPMSEVIGSRDRYDYIVASHVIEHVPDILGFLKECDVLLKPEGVLFLAVPDKRRCFDVFRPLASTGDVLQAHHEQRRVHTPATAFDHVANLASLDTKQGWSAGAQGTLQTQHPLSFAHAVFKRATSSAEYFDFHAWVFTPSSFRLIVRDLNELNVLRLRECAFRATDGIEFYVTLSRSGHGCPSDRLTLLQTMQDELRDHPRAPPIEAIPDTGAADLGCNAASAALNTDGIQSA